MKKINFKTLCHFFSAYSLAGVLALSAVLLFSFGSIASAASLQINNATPTDAISTVGCNLPSGFHRARTSLVASGNHTIKSIDLKLSRETYGAPVGDLFLKIYDSSFNLIATSNNVDYSTIPAPPASGYDFTQTNFNFTSTFNLVSGATYYIYIERTQYTNFTAYSYYFISQVSDGNASTFSQGETTSVNNWQTVAPDFWYQLNGLSEYCGDTICQTASESCSTCATDCGACSGLENIQIFDAQLVQGLYFRFNESGINYCRVDMSCAIKWNFDTGIFGKNATGKLYYQSSATSTQIYLGTVNLNTQGALGVYGSGNWVATSSVASTDFSYISVVPHSDIYNQDYATTTTAFYFLSAADFTIKYDDVWNAENVLNDLGLDTHALACTDEQWASTSSIPFIGVNIERTICNTRQWLLDTGLKPMTLLTNKLKGFKDKLMTVFPFSIINSIQSSWGQSVKDLTFQPRAALASDFSTTTGAYTGDFSIPLGDLFGDGIATNTRLTFFSKESLESLVGVDGFYWFNMIMRIILWVAFFGYCWWLITDRMHDEITN